MPNDLTVPDHYPPELLQLLVTAISLLCPYKADVVEFFRGAGVPRELLSPHALLLKDKETRDLFVKPKVARQILSALNERGEPCLRERREIVRRVVQWDNFSHCYEDSRDKAISTVAQIRELVRGKDTLTKIAEEREREAAQRRAPVREALARKQIREQQRQRLVHDFGSLFAVPNASRRGKLLEGVLNELFVHYAISVRDAFEVREPELGCTEQVDGVVHFDSHFWLVEMKWHAEPLGPEHLDHHIMRALRRKGTRALLVSASDYTGPMVSMAREAGHLCPCVLCNLREFYDCLYHDRDLGQMLVAKAEAAMLDRNPYLRWSPS